MVTCADTDSEQTIWSLCFMSFWYRWAVTCWEILLYNAWMDHACGLSSVTDLATQPAASWLCKDIADIRVCCVQYLTETERQRFIQSTSLIPPPPFTQLYSWGMRDHNYLIFHDDKLLMWLKSEHWLCHEKVMTFYHFAWQQGEQSALTACDVVAHEQVWCRGEKTRGQAGTRRHGCWICLICNQLNIYKWKGGVLDHDSLLGIDSEEFQQTAYLTCVLIATDCRRK